MKLRRPPSSAKFRAVLLSLVTGAAFPIWSATEAPAPRRLDEVRAVLERIPAPDPAAGSRPLRIVLLADVKDHGPGEHDYPLWQRRWRVLLGGTGGEVTDTEVHLYGPEPGHREPDASRGAPGVQVTTAWEWPGPAQWASADLVVATCYLKWNGPRFREVDTFLKRGGGLVLIHAATWTKPDPSSEVAALTGVGGFTRWREGLLELEVKTDHAIGRGLPARIVFRDEAYWPPTPPLASGDIEVVAATRPAHEGSSSPDPQPLFWTRTQGRGRVFGCVLGHYNWTFDDPYFRLLLLRGMAWAVGDSPYRFDSLTLRGARVTTSP